MTLGERIRAARGKLTQNEFGEMVGVLGNTVCRWERNFTMPQGASARWFRKNAPDVYAAIVEARKAPPVESSDDRVSATGTEG